MRRNEETQELMFDLNDTEDWQSAYAELLETSIGQKYLTEYYDEANRDSDVGKVLRAVGTLFNLKPENAHASVRQLAQALEKVILAGKIRPLEKQQEAALPVPAAPAALDTTPKLTGSQQAWREFRIWSESHSSSECKTRARAEEAYGNFYHKNLEKEFAEQAVGDAVVPEGQASGQAVTAELREFGRLYRLEPSANLKPKSGLVTLGGRQISWSYFQQQLEAATAAGVI